MDNDRSSARGWEQHPSTLTGLKVASWPARAGFLFLCASALAMACGCDGAVQAAPRLKVLHSFAMQRGQTPLGDLIADASGNLYGTTEVGGADNDGIVFELRPPAAGNTAWTEKVLHSFHGTDGANPSAALISDGAGNLYGTTGAGGKNFDGVVFELRAPAEGKTAWTESVLHTFEGSDGAGPYGGLIADRAGNLYGTTFGGGAYGAGVAYELSPPAQGNTAWTQKVLAHFDGSNGAIPSAGLIEDGAGNFYGTTESGGESGAGLVFELIPPAQGQTAWFVRVLLTFNSANGANPLANLLLDQAGSLYGTTSAGGPNNLGVVFELSPPKTGTTWTETLLYPFTGANGKDPDGAYPLGRLIADASGSLYGTTSGGGPYGAGAVFKLTPPPQGQATWTETLLRLFNGTDGEYPAAGLLADGEGNFYGTTALGGTNADGDLFKIMP